MRDTYRLTMRHLFFPVMAYRVENSLHGEIQVGKVDFGGVGKGKKGPKLRKTPCGQTRKLCYAYLPGL